MWKKILNPGTYTRSDYEFADVISKNEHISYVLVSGAAEFFACVRMKCTEKKQANVKTNLSK